MGYECPVCGVPQADRRHLADHLALTAATRGGDHERWLDDHVPDWGEMGPDDLGPEVAEYADEAEDPRVFDDTTGGHDHDVPDRLEDHLAATGRGRGDLTAEQRSIVARAREMTAEMEQSEGDGGEAGDDDREETGDDGEDSAHDEGTGANAASGDESSGDGDE